MAEWQAIHSLTDSNRLLVAPSPGSRLGAGSRINRKYAGKGKCCMWNVNSGNIFPQNRFGGLQMVHLENPRVIHPFYFGVHYGVPYALHAGKMKHGVCNNGSV